MNEMHTPNPSRLERDPNGMIGGVAAGLASYTNIDVSLVRLGFLALTVFGGSGPLVYAAAWLIIPEAEVDTVAP